MKKSLDFTSIELGTLIVNVELFVVTLVAFFFQVYIGAILAFVAFAVCSMFLVVLIFDGAQKRIIELAAQQVDDADFMGARLDDAMVEANQEKSKLELEIISLKEANEKLEKDVDDQKRITDEVTKQLEFKNNEFKELSELFDSQRESLLKKSLIPNPENDNKENINIINLAKDSAEQVIEYAKAAGVEIKFSCKEPNLFVVADKERLDIMFRNIMENSVKHMGKSGQLVVTISRVEDYIFIVLKDNGNGLANDEISNIFDRNYRGSSKTCGNGLGLTQAKAIVDYYGGNIYAKSGTNCGMAIYIQLPAN